MLLACWPPHWPQVPELIFGNLLTSSNYNDNEKKVRRCEGGDCEALHAVQHDIMRCSLLAGTSQPPRLLLRR